MDSQERIALIGRFLEVCVRADPEEFASYFTEDSVWWNAPWKPVEGRDAISETLRRGAERMVALPWEIRHIVAEGDVVMVERVDNFLVGDKRVHVPCMGIFELRGEKIAAWRDYWDLKQFENQIDHSTNSDNLLSIHRTRPRPHGLLSNLAPKNESQSNI
jgi:limonene-1,2-epoxide hydrolase